MRCVNSELADVTAMCNERRYPPRQHNGAALVRLFFSRIIRGHFYLRVVQCFCMLSSVIASVNLCFMTVSRCRRVSRDEEIRSNDSEHLHNACALDPTAPCCQPGTVIKDWGRGRRRRSLIGCSLRPSTNRITLCLLRMRAASVVMAISLAVSVAGSARVACCSFE